MQVQAIVGGTKYNVTGRAEDLYLVAHDGLGDASLTRLVERGAQQDGDTDVGFRYDPRVFTLGFEHVGSMEDRYDKRARLRRIFAPQAQLSVRFTLANADVRQIDCKRLAVPGSVDGARALSERLVYRFRAANPLLYDPTQETATWTLSVINGLVLPYTLPYLFGSSIINNTQNIAYTGDADEHPVITITGPLTYVSVENEETDESLTLEETLVSGEQVVIDTRYGQKSVVKTGGARLVLTDDSDLGTFHLAAAVDGTASRTNTLRVSATGAQSGQTSIEVAWYSRYGGI
jgi:hypothetical protein